MNKSEIISNLNNSHSAFWNTAIQLPNTSIAINNKWSVCQNVEHINIVLTRVGNYLALPKSNVETQYGISERTSISYEELTNTYLKAISNGVKAMAPFIPELNLNDKIEVLISQSKNLLEMFISNLQDWSEEELEMYNCLHPVLGITTAREILYFTIYHVQHHNEIIKKMQSNESNSNT